VGYLSGHSRRGGTLYARVGRTDLADALAFRLRFDGRKGADELMSTIVVKRFVERLERSGFVAVKRPPIYSSAVSWT
jgi:hypothetical protein